MVSAILSRFVILTVGTLYPAYRSYKGVKTKNVREYVRWMMYWIIFALFLCAEAFADIFVAFWCPLYYELKIAVVLWLISPYTKGASLLYRKFVHPFLMKHEKEIDLYLDKMKRESYTRVVRLGNRGINYAKEAVATAALRSHEHIIGQLRKTTSLNDVNNDSQSENLQFSPEDEDEVDLGMVIRRRPKKQRPALLQAKGAASRMTQSVSGDFVQNSHVTATTNQERVAEDIVAEEAEQNYYGEEEASSLVEQEFGYLEGEEEAEEDQDQEDEEGVDEKGDEDDEDYVPSGTLRQRLLVKRSAKQQQRKTVDDMEQYKKMAAKNASSPSENAYATLPRRSQRKVVKKQ